MILTCPNCGTQYVVKDGAIPPEGRQVRCAACKHSWHQEPGDDGVPGSAETNSDDIAVSPEPQTAPADGVTDYAAMPESDEPEDAEENESLAEATLIEPRSGPEAEERAFEEAVIGSNAIAEDGTPPAIAETEATAVNEPEAADWNEPPQAEAAPDDFSPFAAGDFVEERKRSPLATILIVVLVILVLAAALWFFAPLSLKAKLGLAAASASPLSLAYTHSDRQKLESGNELLTVSGRVINPTMKEQNVPPLQAQLRGRGGKVVYSWTIAPPAPTLPAGGSASFNSAEVNPPGGEYLTITLGAPKA